ncbi:MAG: transposase [Nitrospira sp.]|nr:transposase [Nitrospira sp.]
MEPITEDHTQKSLDGYYAKLTQAQRDGIETVAMDMWELSSQAMRAQVPDAEDTIVFKHVHVIGHVGKAVDTMRKSEHRALMASGDETLKGGKYVWL